MTPGGSTSINLLEQFPIPRLPNPLLAKFSFSGGLDSLAAAVEFSHGSDSLALVSHHTMNRQTTTAQSTLYQMLLKKGCKLTHHSFFVSARDKDSFEHAIENSQRTRSFLFLTLAAITANRLGRREIVVIAENGQMAIHLPLNSARIAAFSTHTAHPDVLAEMQLYLRGAFSIDFVIQNPYVLKTKKEVIEPIVKTPRDHSSLQQLLEELADQEGSNSLRRVHPLFYSAHCD